MRAVGVELARLAHRRAVVLLVALGLLGCLLVLGFSAIDAAPPSASARATAQAEVDRQLADPQMQQQLAACRAATGADGGDGTAASGDSVMGAPIPPAGMTCDEALAPKIDWFLNWSPPDYVTGFKSMLQSVALLLALAMALAGITFAGAGFAAGTIGTQLTFQPRRWLVFGSKAAAVAAVGLAAGVVGAALTWVQSYAVAAAWGTTAMVDTRPSVVFGSGTLSGPVPVTVGDLAGWAVRAAILVAIAAVGGYLLAMLFRSSLVAVSILAAYGIAGEALLRNLAPAVEPYLLSTRLWAWLSGPYHIQHWPRHCGGPGVPCEPVTTTITVAGGGIYLLVLLAAGMAVVGIVFARRDVD